MSRLGLYLLVANMSLSAAFVWFLAKFALVEGVFRVFMGLLVNRSFGMTFFNCF